VGCDPSSEKDMNICKREEVGKNPNLKYRQREGVINSSFTLQIRNHCSSEDRQDLQGEKHLVISATTITG
jgi:hypothetical protein